MLQESLIGLHRGVHVSAVAEVELLHVADDPAERLVRYIVAVGLDECSEELHTLTDLADVELAHVEFQRQSVIQELTDRRHLPKQPFVAGVHDRGVIDITPVMACQQHTLHELVELIEIDIRE